MSGLYWYNNSSGKYIGGDYILHTDIIVDHPKFFGMTKRDALEIDKWYEADDRDFLQNIYESLFEDGFTRVVVSNSLSLEGWDERSIEGAIESFAPGFSEDFFIAVDFKDEHKMFKYSEYLFAGSLRKILEKSEERVFSKFVNLFKLSKVEKRKLICKFCKSLKFSKIKTSSSLSNLFLHSAELIILSQYSRDEFQLLNNFIFNEDNISQKEQERLTAIVTKKFKINNKEVEELRRNYNSNHALLLRTYPNLLNVLFKVNSIPIIEHIFKENAPSHSTLLSILSDYELPKGIGKKIRNEIGNLITQSLGQPVSLPSEITKQFINFIKNYSSVIKGIFNSISDPNDQRILLLKQQYVPQQDLKSILELQNNSLDPKGTLDSIQFGSSSDKEKVLELTKKNDEYTKFFMETFLPAFQPESTNKVYIYDLYIWGYYNRAQFNSIVSSKKLNREGILNAMQGQAFEWMHQNLEVPPQSIKVYERGKFPEKNNGEEGENFLQIKNLNTSLDLTMESSVLNHCAGTYHQEAVEGGEEEFYSVQDINGVSKATIVLKKKEGYGQYYVSEIRGANNSRPNEKYMVFAGEWLNENNIQESSHSEFKTGYKTRREIDDGEEFEINQMVYYHKFNEVGKLVKNKTITLDRYKMPFWNYVFQLIISGHIDELIFEKIITQENLPLLFNYIVYGNENGEFVSLYERKQIDSGFEDYILSQAEYYLYSSNINKENHKPLMFEKLSFACKNFVPLIYVEEWDWPEEGADDLYDEYKEKKIENDYNPEDFDSWYQNEIDEHRHAIEEDWDWDEFPEGPSDDEFERELESEGWEMGEEYDNFVEADKQAFIDENFPEESFQFRKNVMLVLKGAIRPGSPGFNDLFEKIKEDTFKHKYIKNWVLKGSAISRNESYLDYYHDLANYWLENENKNIGSEFRSKEFASLAVYTKAISRLDGVENLEAFLSKMSSEEEIWGYKEFNLEDVIEDGVVSRLDYPSDKDAKIDFIIRMRKIGGLDAFNKYLSDDDTSNELLDLAISEAEEGHQKYSENPQEIWGVNEKESFYSKVGKAFRLSYKEGFQSSIQLAEIIANGEYPEEILNFMPKNNDLDEAQRQALNNLVLNKEYKKIQKLFGEYNKFNLLLEKFPKEHAKAFYALFNYVKTNYDSNPEDKTNARILDILFRYSDYTNYLNDVVNYFMEKGKYSQILGTIDRLPPRGDPRREEIINQGITQIKEKEKLFSGVSFYNLLKNKIITKEDGEHYFTILGEVLKDGNLPSLILDQIITIKDKDIFPWITENPEFWENIENKNYVDVLTNVISEINKDWGVLYEMMAQEYVNKKYSSHQQWKQLMIDTPNIATRINEEGLGEKIIEKHDGDGLFLLESKLINPGNLQLALKALDDALYHVDGAPPTTMAMIIFRKGIANIYGNDFIEKTKNAIDLREEIFPSDLIFLIENGFVKKDENLYFMIISKLAKNGDWNDLEKILSPEEIEKVKQELNLNQMATNSIKNLFKLSEMEKRKLICKFCKSMEYQS